MTDRSVQFATAKTYVFLTQCYVWEVSVLNQSKHGKARLNVFWKRIISKNWIGSTGKSRWNSSGKFPRIHNVGTARLNPSANLSTSKEGSSSCRCTMTLIGDSEETKKIQARTLVVSGASMRKEMVRNSLWSKMCWSFLVPRCEKKWYGTHVNKPDGQRDKTAEGMMLNFAESGHPILRATSALERGELKSKGKGVTSIHFNGSDDTIDLILRTIISVNQLGIYGAVADLRGE